MTSENTKIDLTNEQFNIVRQILQKIVPDYKVGAFGSRVKGTARKYSDLDLVVYSDEPISLQIQAELAEAFSDSDLPFKVDIVNWATTSDSFRKIIEQDQLILQNTDRC